MVIKIKNFGTITETEIRYALAPAFCSDEDTDSLLECNGNVTYSAACRGEVGPLAPGQRAIVGGCTATYSGTTGDDKWLHVLVITHCGTDGVGVCSTSDGGTDANLSNNLAIKRTRVVP